MQNLIATTSEVVHYIALQAVHYKPLQEVHLSRYWHLAANIVGEDYEDDLEALVIANIIDVYQMKVSHR